ncbi:MAG: SMP-30/gluconolactonase/LRE family protein [Hyphomicrobiaceae bacterium]|nr:SMP-30/gluconolactonase/LRE family protein [Hyphomicrobiaceae bacterium]
MNLAFERVGDVEGAVLEGPTWDAATATLWFVDITAPALVAHRPADGGFTRHPMPCDVGCLGLRAGGGLIVALRSGVSFYDPSTRQLTPVFAADWDPATTRANDGGCDRQGRFWFGTMFEPRTSADAVLYRVDADLSVHRVVTGLTISNGLGFGLDGTSLYHADTPTSTVWRWRLDPATGTLTDRHEFARLGGDLGRPDGATVDAEDHYWVAGISAGLLHRFAPDGRLVASVPVAPTLWPTMPCFGGDHLGTLYLTSLRQGRAAPDLARYPHSGGLFSAPSPIRGIPAPRFAG